VLRINADGSKNFVAKVKENKMAKKGFVFFILAGIILTSCVTTYREKKKTRMRHENNGDKFSPAAIHLAVVK
jgi:hypothetical protein